MQANAEHGILPFFLATLTFTALFATVGPKSTLYPWLSAVLALLVVRLYLISIYWKSHQRSDTQWVRWNVAILGGLGCLYGASPFLFPSNGEIWLLAVTNMWLAGLVVVVVLSQGIVAVAGLAFALPAIVPLFCLLLFSGEATQTLIGLGNAIIFTFLYPVIRRTRSAIIDEAKHRVRVELLAEYYDQQRQRSDELVGELTKEIERRKEAEAARLESRDAAEAISNLDHLTGLANRRIFDRVLSREWAQPLSLIVCDIDLLSSYNQHYGNRAGDQYLVRIAETIAQHTKRAGDFAARNSGEQFSILLPESNENAALDVAETIRQAVYELTILHPGAVDGRVVTASFGVATLVPASTDTQHHLVEAADYALLRAKRGGGNCVFAIFGDLANREN
ncbi:MAG: diguanylate cyclase (GGDEF)-like protein [Gammaproteobacteria bacterium]|jgi:diguanylate cyclase (GGDEF)-like protein